MSQAKEVTCAKVAGKRPSPAYKYLINVKCVQSKKQALGIRDKWVRVASLQVLMMHQFQQAVSFFLWVPERPQRLGQRLKDAEWQGRGPTSGGRDHFTPSTFTHVCHDIQSHPIGKDHSFIITIIMITIIVYFWMTFSLQSVSHAALP